MFAENSSKVKLPRKSWPDLFQTQQFDFMWLSVRCYIGLTVVDHVHVDDLGRITVFLTLRPHNRSCEKIVDIYAAAGRQKQHLVLH